MLANAEAPVGPLLLSKKAKGPGSDSWYSPPGSKKDVEPGPFSSNRIDPGRCRVVNRNRTADGFRDSDVASDQTDR